MGADLYIPKLHKAARDAHGKRREELSVRMHALQSEGRAFVPGRTVMVDGLRFPEPTPAYRDLRDEATKLDALILADAHYFRDSYNATSLAARCGWSWWQNVGPLCDACTAGVSEAERNADGFCNLTGAHLERFAALVRAKPPAADLSLYDPSGWEDGTTAESLRDYFRNKHARLLAFISNAVEHGGIYASL